MKPPSTVESLGQVKRSFAFWNLTKVIRIHQQLKRRSIEMCLPREMVGLRQAIFCAWMKQVSSIFWIVSVTRIGGVVKTLVPLKFNRLFFDTSVFKKRMCTVSVLDAIPVVLAWCVFVWVLTSISIHSRVLFMIICRNKHDLCSFAFFHLAKPYRGPKHSSFKRPPTNEKATIPCCATVTQCIFWIIASKLRTGSTSGSIKS
mmetsp:Transcript_9108/g.28242  ORF Transcript_9108/g.28242 Transcript_9108/m.28242 type:complete len:202 (-) Transcript_9108:99-704(-)